MTGCFMVFESGGLLDEGVKPSTEVCLLGWYTSIFEVDLADPVWIMFLSLKVSH